MKDDNLRDECYSDTYANEEKIVYWLSAYDCSEYIC